VKTKQTFNVTNDFKSGKLWSKTNFQAHGKHRAKLKDQS